MMRDAVVRPAVPADLPAVHALVAASGLPLDGLDGATQVLVAEEDGDVVGTVALERHGDGPATAFLLRSAAVAERRRGTGLGAALVTAALAPVDAAGAPVALLTESAANWFPRFGFVVVPREELPPALGASAELRGACPASAHALLRPPTGGGR
ncbi:GNAT family N-acetyltransferase [Geodermatophilus sp. SYSU D00691]